MADSTSLRAILALALMAAASASTVFFFDAKLTPARNAAGKKIKTKATATAQVILASNTLAMCTLDVKGLKGFQTADIRSAASRTAAPLAVLYDASARPAGNASDYARPNITKATFQTDFFFNPSANNLAAKLASNHTLYLVLTTTSHKGGELWGKLVMGNSFDFVPSGSSSSTGGSGSGGTDVVQSIFSLLTSLSKAATDAGIKVGLGFVGKAMLLFAKQGKNAAVHEELGGPKLDNVDVVRGLYADARQSSFAYDKAWLTAADPKASIASISGFAAEDILAVRTSSELRAQPYFVALDRSKQRILVVIRGSASVDDWITNALGSTRVIAKGVGAHDGMFVSASNLLASIADTVVAALAANTGFSLAFTGHSLGGGVCALSAYLVNNGISDGGAKIKAATKDKQATGNCFSTPPVLTMDAAASASAYMTTTMVEDDVVPRASAVNIKFLLEAVNGRRRSLIEDENYNYDATAVKDSTAVGSTAIYPMYAPGVMYQLLTSGGAQCAAGIKTGASPTDRLKTIYLKENMINDHLIEGILSCLTNQPGVVAIGH